MYYRAEQILSAYPKEFTGNMKGRGSILCTDREGIYLLKEYTGSLHRLELLEEALRYLKEQGFLGLFSGGFKAGAVGCSAALIFGYLASLIFQPKMKK